MCLQRPLGGEGVKGNNWIVLKKKVISKPVLNVFCAGRDWPSGGLRQGVGMSGSTGEIDALRGWGSGARGGAGVREHEAGCQGNKTPNGGGVAKGIADIQL